MERVPLSNGVSLSRIVYGMWRLGDDPDTSDRHIRSKVEACLAHLEARGLWVERIDA